MNLDYRPDDPAFLADPFPMFRRLQDEDPCHWSPRLKAWVLTRYEDVRCVCQDKAMSSDRLRPYFATLPPAEAQRIAELMRYLTLWMVFRDPPEHTRLRGRMACIDLTWNTLLVSRRRRVCSGGSRNTIQSVR